MDYRSALEQRNRRAILEELAKAGGQNQSLPLKGSVGLSQNTFGHQINILRMNNVISIEGDKIRLERKTPLCYIFNSTKIPYAYLGLLGERKGRSESETETALKLLAKENFPKENSQSEKDQKHEIKVTVFETYKSIPEWENITPSNINWHLLRDEEITNVKTVEEKVEQVLKELIRNHILVMDCTALNKPATIAYYKLAEKYMIPLIYVYEDEKELIWLISKEDIKRELLPPTEKDERQN